jgi:hypothetical protein
MKKLILKNREQNYRGYYIILGFLLIPATKEYQSRTVLKDILTYINNEKKVSDSRNDYINPNNSLHIFK